MNALNRTYTDFGNAIASIAVAPVRHSPDSTLSATRKPIKPMMPMLPVGSCHGSFSRHGFAQAFLDRMVKRGHVDKLKVVFEPRDSGRINAKPFKVKVVA